MRLLRLLVASLALLGTQLVSPVAWAQSVDVAAIIKWSNEASRGDRMSSEINRADCLADATVTFSTDVQNPVGSFEVWVGTACTELNSRTERQCVQVAALDSDARSVPIRVQDLLQEPGGEGSGLGGGTDATCDGSNNQAGGIDLHVFFMLLDEGNGDTKAQKDVVFKYDITPPPPPTNIEAGPGEDSLELTFTESTSDDLAGYRFYCSEIGAPPEQAAGGADDGSSPPATGDCTSSVLIPGEDPPAEAGYACGSTNSAQATDGTATGRTNGTRYAVAVAAFDGFENNGKLSALACGTPQEVTGFFEAYRAAGGQGGGGFCSFGPARRGATAIGLALLLVGATLLRRRK
jgi:hypothetical protein